MTRIWKPGWVLGALSAGALALVACSGGGSTAAPVATTAAPATPAAAAKPSSALLIRADTVIGSKGMSDADKPLRSCTAVSRIKLGESIGWRVKVYDSATGKDIEADSIAKILGGAKAEAVQPALESVTVKLGDGQVFTAKFAGHGGTPPADGFWSYWWVVPADYPTGVLPYTISVKAKDGRTATFASDAFNIKSSWLTVMAK